MIQKLFFAFRLRKLGSTKESRRKKAAIWFGKHGNASMTTAIPSLLDRIREANDIGIEAIRALGKIGNTQAIIPLLMEARIIRNSYSYITERKENVIEKALLSIGESNSVGFDNQTVSTLISVLRSGNPRFVYPPGTLFTFPGFIDRWHNVTIKMLSHSRSVLALEELESYDRNSGFDMEIISKAKESLRLSIAENRK